KQDALIVQAGVVAAAAITIVLAATMIWLYWGLFGLNQDYHTNSTQIEKESQQTIEQRCALLVSDAQEECISEARKSAKEKTRQEADLYAQWQMAYWAAAVGITAFVSVFLSLIGIFFIWRSLELNRNAVGAALAANNISQDMGERQTRAYVHLVSLSVDFDPEGRSITIQGDIKNSGASPARKTCVATMWICEPSEFNEDWWNEFPIPTSEGSLGPGGVLKILCNTSEKSDPQKSLTPLQIRQVQDGSLNFWFISAITYNDVFDGLRKTFDRHRLATRTDGGFAFVAERTGKEDT
ncbi:MAG: hypothetical protein KDK75_01170, partial [Alphaproteobacteria bacterium]|nr:hypothetical protein [Alphaproteobacteria bacterium]